MLFQMSENVKHPAGNRIQLTGAKNNEGCEVRTRADNRPKDLKSSALDHSANPPEYPSVSVLGVVFMNTGDLKEFYESDLKRKPMYLRFLDTIR